MGKTNRRRYRKKGESADSSAASPKHESRTPGLEDVVFTYGTAKDAAAFEHTLGELVKYVGVQSWRGAPAASLALSSLEKPVHVPPTRPTAPKKKSIVKDESVCWPSEIYKL